MPKKKKFKAFVSEDMSDQLVVQDENQEITQLDLPDEMDVSFIEDQVKKLKNSRSATATYFRSLRARFSGQSQLKVLKLLEEINNAVSAGIGSEIEILKKRQALLLAQRELWITEQDNEEAQEELELKKLERKIELMEQRFETLKKEKVIKRKLKELDEGDDDGNGRMNEAKGEDFDYFDDKDNK